MLQQDLSNKLWRILEIRGRTSRLYAFSVNIQGHGVRIETFSVWKMLNTGRREKRRDYYRMVRDATGAVLYDQLEMVIWPFVKSMEKDRSLVPEIRISPEKANKLLCAALEEQREVDRLIAGKAQ